jgi:hypothetical protein
MIDDSPYEAMKKDRRKIKLALIDTTETQRVGRPFCPCAGILQQRMILKDNAWFCKKCGIIQPIRKDDWANRFEASW